MRRFIFLLFAAALFGQDLTAPEQTALDRISAQSMRGNLSFLASDALEGRATPSPGLNIAAEFIAACFRRAGLQAPVPNYFQVADFLTVAQKLDDFRMKIAADGDD